MQDISVTFQNQNDIFQSHKTLKAQSINMNYRKYNRNDTIPIVTTVYTYIAPILYNYIQIFYIHE